VLRVWQRNRGPSWPPMSQGNMHLCPFLLGLAINNEFLHAVTRCISCFHIPGYI
jgi:hypothetical protein